MTLTPSLSSDLWTKAKNQRLHYVFREQALLNLLDFDMNQVVTYCHTLLKSSDDEEWFMALKVLSSSVDEAALNILSDYYSALTDRRRYIVLQYIQRALQRRVQNQTKMKQKSVIGVTAVQMTRF